MHKSRILKVSLLLSVFVSCFSCKMSLGMGESPDLEAPVINITSPKPYDKVGLNFILQGTCTDNIGVTSVEISNNDTGELLGTATINGNNWVYQVKLPASMDETEVSLLATAKDAANNVSVKSYKPITLSVDVTAPIDLDWSIDRGNGILVPLYELDILKNFNLLLQENKDIPQNELFNIKGNFYDKMSINEIIFYIKDINGKELIRKTVSSDPDNVNFIGEDNSIFSPIFTFTHDELKNIITSETEKNENNEDVYRNLSTGIHYLQAGYIVKDDHGNSNQTDLKWFVWYPESDLPQIYQNQIRDNVLPITIDTEFPLDIFDDDGLLNVYYALKKQTIYTSIPGSDLDEKCQTIIKNTGNIRNTIFANIDTAEFEVGNYKENLYDTRAETPSLRTPTKPDEMYLIVCVQDINGKWNCNIIRTVISDASSPMLNIKSPKNNEKPIMNNGTNTFTIEGSILGKNPSQKLQIVYVSGSQSVDEKKVIATNILNKPSVADPEKGQFIKNIPLQPVHDYEGAAALKEQEFEITFDILTELSQYDSENEVNYFFMFRLTGTTGNIDTIYQLNKDIDLPTIKISNPSNMEAIDYLKNDLLVRFAATKKSGLSITDYKVTFYGHDYTTSDSTYKLNQEINEGVPTGYYYFTIPKDTLQTIYENRNPQPAIQFYVKDALGFEAIDERTIVLTTLPTLDGITTEHPDATYIAGDVLYFQVKFSDAVKVITPANSTVKPRIKIAYSGIDATAKWATYERGSGTNTLTFKYIVPEGAESNGILIKPLDANNTAIDLTGGLSDSDKDKFCSIKPVSAGEGSAYITTTKLLTGKTLQLDGIKPTIQSFNLSAEGTVNADGYTYLKDRNVITVSMTMSEGVQITGNPVLNMKVGNVNLPFVFDGINDKTLTFIHTVSASSPNGIVKNTQKTCFDNTNKAFIKDKNGNELTLSTTADSDSVYVIDTKPPATLSVKLLNSSGSIDNRTTTYDYEPTLLIVEDNMETGCTYEYSLNNGASWTLYSKNDKPVITDGSYNILAKQTDKAGNTSALGTPKTITVKAAFPSVSGLSVKTPKGKYKYTEDDSNNPATKVEFILSFAEKVKVPANSATLTFTNIAGTVTKVAKVIAAPSGTNNVYFEYYLQQDEDIQGVKITNITFQDTFVDEFGHKVSTAAKSKISTLALESARNDVILDAKAPFVITYSPENTKVSTKENTAGNFEIVLTFSEPIYKEKGVITLQRKGQWGIPAVIEGPEFKQIYDQLDSNSQQKLIWTDEDGDLTTDHTDSWTGISVGPYKKITHGINADGSPDTDTKFVLDWNLGLFNDSVDLDKHNAVNSGYNIGKTDGKTFLVADIRTVLESVNYHKHTIDVNDRKVNFDYETNQLTITMPTSIEPGIEWELIIPSDSFRDAAGNYYKGLKASTWTDKYRTTMSSDSDYTLWSKGVSTPVIRVDRYSHGFGGQSFTVENEVIKNFSLINKVSKKNAAENNIKMNIAPTGYARVRVDCETKNVIIKHGIKMSDSCAYNNTSKTTTSDSSMVVPSGDWMGRSGNKCFTSRRSNIPNITKASLENDVTLDSETVIFAVGDTSYTTARKDYVVAKAINENLGESEIAYEGVFRTVVYVSNGSYDRTTNTYDLINIEGGTSKGGEAKYYGFPLKDGCSSTKENYQYSKNMYRIGTSHNYVWNSYEILNDDAALLIAGANYSRDYPYVSYGNVTNILSAEYYVGYSQE